MQKDLHAVHKHINRYEREYQREGDVDDDYLLRFTDDATGWRGMLLYQFSMGYIITIIVLLFVSHTIAGLQATFMLSVSDKEQIDQQEQSYIILFVFYLIDYVYVVDLVFKLLYKFCATTNQKSFQNTISGDQLAIDIISVIPFEVLYVHLFPNPTREMEIWLRCRCFLRLVRLYTHIFQIDKHMSNLSFVILKLIMLTCELSRTISFVHYVIYCKNPTSKCKYQDFSVYFAISHITLNSMISTGIDYGDYFVEDMAVLYDVFSWIYKICCVYTVSVLVCLKLEKSETIYQYVDEFSNIIDCYHLIKKQYKTDWTYKDDRILSVLKSYYDYFLKKRDGTWVDKEMITLLPKSQMIGVLADVSFNALKHSHIFKKLDQHLLRYLSTKMKFDFVVPGQVIVLKGDPMQSMIYISHGVLQILSQEDCETSVLSLSGGSCIGEFSLFFQCPSTCTIVCQTYSELVILPAKKFQKLIKKYPKVYLELRNVMMKRLAHAKYLSLIRQTKSKNDVLEKIKIFQRDLLCEDAEKKLENYQESLDNFSLYIAHFDRIAVSDDIELVEDPVFLKSSFHFILQPNSPLLNLWEVLILITCIIHTLFYPIYITGKLGDISSLEKVLSIVVTMFYIFDVYIQMCTAIKTRGGTNITIKSILFYRLTERSFLLDVFAAVPFEIILFTIIGKIPNKTLRIIQSNRLLKYYRIEKFLKKFYLSSTNFMTILEILKYSIHILFFYYFVTMIIRLVHCDETGKCDRFLSNTFVSIEADSFFQRFLATFSITQNMLSSMNFSLSDVQVPTIYLIIHSILSITFLLLHLHFFTAVIAANALKQIGVLKKQVMIMNITASIQDMKLNLNNKQISTFLKDLWSPNENSFLSGLTITSLPLDLKLAYRNLHYMRLFSKNPLFSCLPEESVYELSEYINRKRIPMNQEVCYVGQFVKEIITVERGKLKIDYGEGFKLLNPHDNISVIEALLDIPIQHAVTTVSDCLILTISRKDFFLFLNKYPHIRSILMECLKAVQFDTDPEKDITTLRYGKEDTLMTSFKLKRSSAIHAIKTLFAKVTKTFKEGTRVRVIGVQQRFTYYWEIVRCFSAYFNVILTASGYILPRPYNNAFKGSLFFFDVVSYADIFIRCHITYYNEDGIEITKGKMVFKHYITGAFFVDLVSCFPFDLFLTGEIVFTRLNRMLALYRIIGFSNHLINKYQRVGLFLYISIFIIATSIFATIASWDIYINCVYDYENPGKVPVSPKFEAGFLCRDSWLEKSSFKGPLSITQAYFNSLYFLVASFFNIGIRNFKLVHWASQILMSVWVITGFFTIHVLKGCCISTLLFKNDEITTYQDAMKDLVQYLSYREIDKNLRNEVINHFEYIWEKRKGKAIKDVIYPFHNGLKLNTLYETFGKSIMLRSIFSKASPSFIKELLMLARQETFLKTGILYKVNDIHGTIFYLLKGFVEVVGPDEGRILTLYPGALFGCLDNCDISRQTLTMVAKGHVETLTFPSKEFHQIMSKFSMTSRRFKRGTAFNTDYIQSEKIPRFKTQQINVATEIVAKMDIPKSRFFRIYKPYFLYYYEIVLYVIEYIVGVPYEFLALVYFENKILTFVSIYLRDLMWIFRMYLKFHTAYEDEYGMLIFNRKKIAKRYIKFKTGFYFDLAINMPIDLMTFYVMPDYERLDFDQLYHVLRLIKLCRVGFLFNFVKKLTKRLNVNVFLVRSINVLIRLAFMMEVQGLILYIFEVDWVEVRPKKGRPRELFKCLSAIIGIFTRSTIRHRYSNWAALCLTALIYFDVCLVVWLYSEFVSTRQIVTQVKSLREKTIKSLFTFLGIINISKPEIKSIENFLMHFAKLKIGTEFPSLLNEAPYYLKEAVMYSMFGHHLRNHPIFKHCHIDLLRQIAGHMKSQSFYRNYLLTKGDIDSTIYFIQQGIVHAVSKDTLYTEIVEHILIPGDCFGYDQFVYPNVGHHYTYKTDTLVVVATVHRSDLMKLLRFFPASKEFIYNKIYDAL